MNWKPLPKPAEIAETRLLEAILDNRFPINSHLPGERYLATQIGITRPTLREAMQRLARDGWLDIQHGKPTRVRDYWREGSLAVLAILAQSPAYQSPDFVAYLMEVRLLLAPTYSLQAFKDSTDEIAAQLRRAPEVDSAPADFARFDWELHHLLTHRAENPVYRLLLNSFESLYSIMGKQYFAFDECRQHSHSFYVALLACAEENNLDVVEALTRETMQTSLNLWLKLHGGVE